MSKLNINIGHHMTIKTDLLKIDSPEFVGLHQTIWRSGVFVRKEVKRSEFLEINFVGIFVFKLIMLLLTFYLSLHGRGCSIFSVKSHLALQKLLKLIGFLRPIMSKSLPEHFSLV